MGESRNPSEKKQPFAIVIGLDSGTVGIQTSRLLARRQIPVIALARDPQNYCCRTRACDAIIYTDTRTEEFVETLLNLGPTLDREAVLFPCQDESVLLVSRYRESLSTWFKIVLPPHHVVETLIDKSLFYPFARQMQLCVPKSFVLKNAETAQTASEQLTYPCILKPENRSHEWTKRTHEKAFLAQNAEELLALYKKWGEWGGELIAQEWIAGNDGEHFAFNGYFDSAGRVMASAVSRKIRQWPPHTGQGCLSEPCENQKVDALARSLFSSLPFHGLGYVEIKYDRRKNRYVIIEPNIGRPTGRSAGAEANGVELLYAQYCDALGKRIEAYSKSPVVPVKWVHWRRDILSAFHYWRNGKLTLRDWLRSWQGPKVSAIFSWRDPLPFLADLVRSAGQLTGASERRVKPQQHTSLPS